jgi:hypothetical protein
MRDLSNKEVIDNNVDKFAHFQGPRLEFAFTHTGACGESSFSFRLVRWRSDTIQREPRMEEPA